MMIVHWRDMALLGHSGLKWSPDINQLGRGDWGT